MAGELYWPEELARFAHEFRTGARRRYLATPTDKGPPKRRPTGSSYDTLEAVLDLSHDEWRRLEAFEAAAANRPFAFPAAQRLVCFDERPRINKSTVVAGQSARHKVEIVLRVLPHDSPSLP